MYDDDLDTIKRRRREHFVPSIWSEWALTHNGSSRFDESGLADTVWSVCGRCGGKISPRNRNEMVQGYHNRCMTEESFWLAPLRLYAHDGQLEIKLVGKD